MSRSFALMALSATAAIAQTTTKVNLFLPNFDPQPLVASVVKADADITTYAIACAPGTDSADCGIEEPVTLAQGPSTYSLYQSFGSEEFGTAINDFNCEVDRPNDAMTCTVSAYNDFDGTTIDTSTVTSGTGFSTFYQEVTVTAGVDKLNAVPGATDGAASATTTETEAGATTLSTATQAAETSDSSTATTTGGETVSQTGDDQAAATTPGGNDSAGSMMTYNVFMAGLVAMVGGAMLL